MYSVSNRFESKVALVTGAAIGIGKAVAKNYAIGGATVVLSDIVETELTEATKEIRASGAKAESMPCDISSKNSVNKMIGAIIQKHGHLDLLVNNAGVLIPGTIEETSDEIIDKTVGVNLNGVLYTIRAATPHMKRQRYGRIVNVASITGKSGDNSTVFVYGATKGAVIALTRSVAKQLGPHGITCNAVAPHAVMTKMMEYWDEEKKRAMAEKIPVKRLSTPEDISALICFLSSDEASFITGETVNINGGYYMD